MRELLPALPWAVIAVAVLLGAFRATERRAPSRPAPQRPAPKPASKSAPISPRGRRRPKVRA